jgi:hypothetical protein
MNSIPRPDIPTPRCNCNTKTPQPSYHNKGCPVFMHFEIQSLQRKLERYREAATKLKEESRGLGQQYDRWGIIKVLENDKG